MSDGKTSQYQPRPQYDEDYKRRAVELTLQGKHTVRQVAEELGGEVDPESWTGRIVNPESESRSPCPRNDVSAVPI